MRLFYTFKQKKTYSNLISPERKVKLIALKEAKTLGVILYLKNSSCHASVQSINKEAEKYGFNVTFIIINPYNLEIPDWCLKDNFIFLNNKIDISSCGTPQNDKANIFINKKFDFLFSISNRYCFTMEYIAKLSKASFKVGIENSSNNPYDLSIKVKKWDLSLDLTEDILSHLHLIEPQ
ncbi:MAG: hypothetical protein WC305_07380 [Bacteroidales bacterium]|jgi:hypothetical protein